MNRAKSLSAEQLFWSLTWGGVDDELLAAAPDELQGGYKTAVGHALKERAKAMKMYAKAQKLNLKNVLTGSSSRGGRGALGTVAGQETKVNALDLIT